MRKGARRRPHYRDAYGHIALNEGGSAYDLTLFGEEGVTRITITRRGGITLESGDEITLEIRSIAANYLCAVEDYKLADRLMN